MAALGWVALNLQNVMLYGSNGTRRLASAVGGIMAVYGMTAATHWMGKGIMWKSRQLGN